MANNLHRIDKSRYYFDEKSAKRATDFIQTFCQHTKGELAGQKFVLEPWQTEIIQGIFGWKSNKTKLRKFRQCFIFIPRKNGKTTMMVGIRSEERFSRNAETVQ